MTNDKSTSTLRNLEGKVAIVTGAASGIGRATVNLFVAHGASVIAQDINPAVKEVFQGNAQLVPFMADVSKEQAAINVVALATKRFSKLDILINNAAKVVYKPAVAVALEEWDSIGAKGLLYSLEALAYGMSVHDMTLSSTNWRKFCRLFTAGLVVDPE